MPKTIKLNFVERFSEGDTDAQLTSMRKFFQLVPVQEADAIFVASIVKMHEAFIIKSNFRKPMAVYCWDYYLWAHEGRHHGNDNWKQYADLLKMADLIIVPSSTQQLRLKELLGLDSVVVKTGFPTYDMPVTDGGFILDPLRYYPEEQSKWPEQAAKELGIPIIHSEHQYTEEEFRKLVASCTFMTSAVSEASTGALTLMEGLWLGKTTLYSNSPYQGAKDYVGHWGYTFKDGDYKDFKKKMKELWIKRPHYLLPDVRRSITENFGYDRMALQLNEAISTIIK